MLLYFFRACSKIAVFALIITLSFNFFPTNEIADFLLTHFKDTKRIKGYQEAKKSFKTTYR